MNGLFEGSMLHWFLIFLSALIIGLSKSGMKGLDMMNVTIMAIVFGGKASTGIVLPLLCIADVMAVNYYHRHAQWNHFWKLLPWMVVGILIGVIIGKDLNESIFRKVMAFIIILTVVIMLLLEFYKRFTIPHNKLFVALMGLISGFTTMFGNLAGAFSSIYFLAMRMEKNDFIGTAAWVFLVINFFKLPFQFVYWNNITLNTLKIDLLLLPALFIGFFAGIRIVSKIKDDSYRKVVILLTMIGAVFIFLKR
ncbi:sulfite exporter TauE/SafE family protein [Chitinophagaceae bacterium LB-8]|uniref:Probable membrane transporter protein n=1 Tax=Paraflavisolibacter caeni TaxID=2982496 RepID=A0A9X2XNY1_9BACT|nr:sulfite exporter TauE/SafE family protein [Paraflavisolibacter caeni]MCU7549404.1 sulfite exporter TauE/SafE family protein [Paraflavisolibacter caeni]